MTSKSDSNGQWNYFYDYENRLVSARKFGGLIPRANESVNYQYDALGRRVVRQDKKTGRTEFTHDGMDVIQDRFEKTDGSLSTTNYINGLGIDDKLKLSNGTTSRYFLTDHLGSTVGMSDTNGNVTESASYDSFGRIQSSNLMTRYQYTGREADEKTGLMYYRARQYDPQIGRFTSEDPSGFEGGINLYAYVLNNPQFYIDSNGESPTVAVAVVGGVVGAGLGAAIAAASGEDATGIAKAAAKGAVVGVVSGLTLGLAGPAIAGALGGGVIGGIGAGAISAGIGNLVGQGFERAVGWRCDFSWQELALSSAVGGLFGGISLRPATLPNQPVVSWAPPGTQPTLVTGRYVMTGGNTFRNYALSGVKQLGYPRSNNVTGNIPKQNLSYPKGVDSIKGYLGQRIIVP